MVGEGKSPSDHRPEPGAPGGVLRSEPVAFARNQGTSNGPSHNSLAVDTGRS